MNVVVRGLLAAGMGIYAALHALQAATAAAAAWSQLAFAATAVVAAALLVGLVSAPPRYARHVEDAAALLALSSAVALTLTLTTGFFGVEEALRPVTVLAYVVEGVVLGAWLVLRRVPAAALEEDAVPPRTGG